MATLSPFIKTASNSSPPTLASLTMTPPSPNSLSGSKTPVGRLSLLSSDIEEDLGFLDLQNNSKYDYLAREEFWLLDDDEYDPQIHRYDETLEWIESFPRSKPDGEDDYFKVSLINGHHNPQLKQQFQTSTPVNGYNRFEYLTKSVSRTATITKRKIETNLEETTPPSTIPPLQMMQNNAKYGTITKGTTKPLQTEGNRTFDVLESKLKFSQSPVITDGSKMVNHNHHLNNNQNTPTLDNINNNRNYPVNTGTITKSNRRVLNVTLDVNNHQSPQQQQHRKTASSRLLCDSSDDNNNNNMDFTTNKPNYNSTSATTTDQEDFGTLLTSSGEELTDNYDLLNKSASLNRTYEIEQQQQRQQLLNGGDSTGDDTTVSMDTETTTGTSSAASSSNRNYPTISRNITRTFLRREASQGCLTGSGGGGVNRKLQKKVYLVSSNDDLLNSDNDNRSTIRKNIRSTSNLTKMSGRSEPNLMDAQCSQLSVHGNNVNQNHHHYSNNNNNQPTRLAGMGNVQSARKFQSRLVGPTNHSMVGINNGGGNRIGGGGGGGIPQSNISRIVRPSSQNGGIGGGMSGIATSNRTSSSKINSNTNNHQIMMNNNGNILPGSKAQTFGSMSSLAHTNQYNMPRAASQIEMNDDYDNVSLCNGDGGGGGGRLRKNVQEPKQPNFSGQGLNRKSTFRVHRPTTMLDVQTLSGDGHDNYRNHHQQQAPNGDQPVVNQVERNHHSSSSTRTTIRSHSTSSKSTCCSNNGNENVVTSTILNTLEIEYKKNINYDDDDGRGHSEQPSQKNHARTSMRIMSLLNNNNDDHALSFEKTELNLNNDNVNNNQNFSDTNNQRFDGPTAAFLNNDSAGVSTSRIPALSPFSFARSSIPVCGRELQHLQRSNNNNNNHPESLVHQRTLVQKPTAAKQAVSALPLMVGVGKTTIPTTIMSRLISGQTYGNPIMQDDENDSWQNDCF